MTLKLNALQLPAFNELRRLEQVLRERTESVIHFQESTFPWAEEEKSFVSSNIADPEARLMWYRHFNSAGAVTLSQSAEALNSFCFEVDILK